jgi:hypothetical protein
VPFRAHATFASTLLAELAHPAHFRRAGLGTIAAQRAVADRINHTVIPGWLSQDKRGIDDDIR